MATEKTTRVDELVRVRMLDVPAADNSGQAWGDYGMVAAHMRFMLQSANDAASEAEAIRVAAVMLWAYNCVETQGYTLAVAEGLPFAKAPPQEQLGPLTGGLLLVWSAGGSMHYVVARATSQMVPQIVDGKEEQRAVFLYPSALGDCGRHCGVIDHWTVAEAWASVCKKLESASKELKQRIDDVDAVRAKIGPRAEDAIEVAMLGGTIELDEKEFRLVRAMCDAVARPQFFTSNPGQCMSPFGLTLLWPVLKALCEDVGEPREAQPLGGFLHVE